MQIFRLPAAFAAITIVGLLSALLGDGVWNALSWVALACPIVATLYFILRSRRSQPR
jgi:Fe2+ transport system protein B